MTATLDEHTSTISIGYRNITNLRFADDIDLLDGSNKELQVLTNRLAESSKAHDIEINHEKSKKIVNSKSNQKANIYLEGISLENVDTFKYQGATLKVDGLSDNELRIRIASSSHPIIWLRNLDVNVK